MTFTDRQTDRHDPYIRLSYLLYKQHLIIPSSNGVKYIENYHAALEYSNTGTPLRSWVFTLVFLCYL